METIIYTNNKRQATDYHFDRIVHRDSIDFCSLVRTETQQHSRQNIRFWVISDNITNLTPTGLNQLLTAVCKHLLSTEGPLKLHYTTISYSVAPSRQSQQGEDENQQDEASHFISQEIYSNLLKVQQLEDFSTFIIEELNFDNNFVKNYSFESENCNLKVSIVNSRQKEIMDYIIQQDCYDFCNQRFVFRKDSNIDFDYIDEEKKTSKCTLNKILLFLYSHKALEKDEGKKKRVRKHTIKQSIAELALQEWKLNEEEVDEYEKVQRDLLMLQQEIENEKILFRSKIKAVENYLGEAINIQQLLNETGDIQGDLKSQRSYRDVSKKRIVQPKGEKRTSVLNIPLNYDKAKKTNNSLSPIQLQMSHNYQFKRIKELYENMKNVENIVLEQNQRIDDSKLRIKLLEKEKQHSMYQNAKEINRIRQTVNEVIQQITRKNVEREIKQKEGFFKQISLNKEKKPSNQALQAVQESRSFFKNLNNNKSFSTHLNSPKETINHHISTSSNMKKDRQNQFSKAKVSLRNFNQTLKSIGANISKEECEKQKKQSEEMFNVRTLKNKQLQLLLLELHRLQQSNSILKNEVIGRLSNHKDQKEVVAQSRPPLLSNLLKEEDLVKKKLVSSRNDKKLILPKKKYHNSISQFDQMFYNSKEPPKIQKQQSIKQYSVIDEQIVQEIPSAKENLISSTEKNKKRMTIQDKIPNISYILKNK